MPIYEYQCAECSQRKEAVILRGQPVKTLICCGTPMIKIISASSIRFKGPGFYVNDYGRGKSEKV